MNANGWRFRSLVGASAVGVSAAVALGVTGLGGGVFAAGANGGPPTAETPSQSNPPAIQPAATPAKKQTLLGTYVESGDGEGEAVASGSPVTLDPVNKLTCPSGESCIITTAISVQLNQSGTASVDQFAAAWTLDGDGVGAFGPWLGSIPTNGSYVGGTWTDQASVPAGKYKVQAEVYAELGGNLDAWTVTYNIYD